MSSRLLGLTLMIVGAVLALIGLAGILLSGGGEVSATAATSTTSAVSSSASTSAHETTTTTPPASPTTTFGATTTTMVATTTTEVVDEKAAIAAFVEEFAAAIAAEDVEFLFDTLHLAVLDVYDEQVCRQFIEEEILLLQDYQLTGELTGPTPTTIGGVALDQYSGPIAFTFQGQDFEAQATFAHEEDGPKWFGECG